jgi:hypothetical protein
MVPTTNDGEGAVERAVGGAAKITLDMCRNRPILHPYGGFHESDDMRRLIKTTNLEGSAAGGLFERMPSPYGTSCLLGTRFEQRHTGT